MKADTQLVLDALTFSRFEVPEHIEFGGEQSLAVHKLVGGKRVVDAMGRDDKDLEWSGVFIGEDAESRANFMNYLRIGGKAVYLSWARYRYSVIVKSATFDYRRKYEIPYKISCLVVEDRSNPIISSADSVDYTITQDQATMNSLGGQIGDGPLSGLLVTLDSAISSVSSFANAAQSVINSVLQPIGAVQARVATLIASTGNAISNISTAGGIAPYNPIAMQAAKLSTQIAGYTQMPLLLNLQSVVGRMGNNLGAVSTSGNTITTAGGDLFTMASKAYGDASAWTTIANANKLTDPSISGVQTLNIPATSDSSGGVLNA